MKLMLGWVDTGAPVSVKPAILDPDLGRPACAPSSDCGLLTASPRMVPGAFLLTVVSLLNARLLHSKKREWHQQKKQLSCDMP
jgi:hypothetical protein